MRRAMSVTALLLALGAAGISCAAAAEHNAMTPTAMTVEEALQRHTESLLAIDGVVGAAVSQCGAQPCILVLVVKNDPETARRIPAQVEGFPVMIRETGDLRKLDSAPSKR